MERKIATASVKRLDEQGRGMAVIATLDVIDRDGDVTQAGAFGEQTVPVVFAHDWKQPAIGKAKIHEAGGQALADFKLNLKMERGKEIYEVLRFDLDNPPVRQQWSYGYEILPNGASAGQFNDQRVRVLKALRVLEISPVLAGAGIDTRTVALKTPTELARCVREGERLCALTLPEPGRPSRPYPFRYKFTTLPVADPRLQAAIAYMHAAVAQLPGATVPSLRFFQAAVPGEGEPDFVSSCPLIGASQFLTHPGVIAIHEGLGLMELAEVVAHEVCHDARPGRSEDAVTKFGRTFAAKALWALPVTSRWYSPVVPYVHI